VDVFSERFDLFWDAYPSARKQGKGKAEEVFRRIKPSQELTERMIRALEIWKCSEQWTKENGQYIPQLARWLREKRWEDIPPNSYGNKPVAANNPPSNRDEQIKRKMREEMEQRLGSADRCANEKADANR
jgi:hypothetical protein